ncbi:MAG: NACHT domain-containing protein [Cyanobacteria bacterium SBLK]|nr:NACHT domain-containing protein [Cyanobacteria bacterium SBLK]
MRLSVQGKIIMEQARERLGWTKADLRLIEAVHTAEGTLRRFWDRKSIRSDTFKRICEVVGVDWQEVFEPPPPPPDPNFVGREEAINDLRQRIDQGAKAILIQGQGGIGKTTLAHHYFETHGFNLVLTLPLPIRQEDIISVELVIEEWLQNDFKQEPGREFGITLDRLRRKLVSSEQKIGVLIDGLEPALQNGCFLPQHCRYAELLRTLTNPTLNAVTLITSREQLSAPGVLVESYCLAGLSKEAWQEYFKHRQIEIDAIVLREIHCAYGGNAAAMRILANAVGPDFKGNLQAYWQANRHNLLLVRRLNNLIEEQFERLQHDEPQAYQLLCRLGCYRYQEIPTLPRAALLALLWDVQTHHQDRVIRALCDRALIEVRDGRYSLLPVIQTKARERLQR